VDDFLPDPAAVRAIALAASYQSSDYHKGRRSAERYLDIVGKADVERLLSISIPDWGKQGMNGRFQFCTAEDALVYHSDGQQWAGALYLTPDAPPESGVSFFRSKVTGLRRPPQDAETEQRMYGGNLYDRTKWEEVDRVGNVYNRLVLWDAKLVHSASCYFGNNIGDSRLFMVLFFDGQ
jgi:hypothetical protein